MRFCKLAVTAAADAQLHALLLCNICLHFFFSYAVHTLALLLAAIIGIYCCRCCCMYFVCCRCFCDYDVIVAAHLVLHLLLLCCQLHMLLFAADAVTF